MQRLRRVIEDLNVMLFNPVGLNILWPGNVAFLFVSVHLSERIPVLSHFLSA